MSIEILASKLPNVMGTYRHLSHTALTAVAYLLVSALLSKVFDVGDRETICLCFFYIFNVFLSKSKKHDFLRFLELLHTFS